MMGVEMFLAALMISLMRGTPSVMFIAATPAKWNVFSVICVPGSPMDCAPKAPTVDPAAGQLPPQLQGTLAAAVTLAASETLGRIPASC
jgi:hypothetical protein